MSRRREKKPRRSCVEIRKKGDRCGKGIGKMIGRILSQEGEIIERKETHNQINRESMGIRRAETPAGTKEAGSKKVLFPKEDAGGEVITET